jgi:hypothetical protein
MFLTIAHSSLHKQNHHSIMSSRPTSIIITNSSNNNKNEAPMTTTPAPVVKTEPPLAPSSQNGSAGKKIDTAKTTDFLKKFHETLAHEHAEHKAGVRSILKELVAYDKIANLNMHQWSELNDKEAKEQKRLAKCEHVVAQSMMDVDLEAHGL